MLKLRHFRQNQLSKTIKGLFSYMDRKDKELIQTEKEKLKSLDSKIAKSHNPFLFKIFNSERFLERLKKMEKEEEKRQFAFDWV